MTDREALDEAMDELREASNRVESWETDEKRQRVKRRNDAIIDRLQAIADELEWHDPAVKLPEDGQAVLIVLSALGATIAAQFFARDGDDEEWWSVSGGVPLSTKHIYRWRAMPVFQRESA